MTVVSDYTALLSGNSWTGGPAGQAVILTYSFSTSPTPSIVSSNAATAASFVPLSNAEKTTVRAALAQWSAASGITFYETTATPGDITLGLYDLSTMGGSGDAGLGTYPATGLFLDANGKPQIYSNFPTEGGDIEFDSAYAANPANATDFAHVALHEIGHALGLKHPFDTPGNTLAPALDTGSQTVMSYSGIRSGTLEPLDIAAIQSLYGTKAGATHPFPETWNAATESLTEFGTAAAQLMFGSGGDDVFYSNGGRDAISGGEGDDIVYANGAPISVNGGPGTDTVVTGLAYTAGMIQGSGTFRYIYLTAAQDFQQFANVERLDFTNGVYDLTTNTFSAVQPGTYAWAGGTDQAWSTPGNWKAIVGGSAANAPGVADAVSIGTAAAATTLTSGGTAASLTLTGPVTFGGNYLTTTLAVGGARMSMQGSTTLAVTTALTIAGGLVTVANTGSGTVLEVGGSGFTLGLAGTLLLDPGGVISGYGVINASGFTDNGTVIATGGTLQFIGAAAGTGGTAQITAGATLWEQSLLGSYVFTGAGATLRTDTPTATSVPVPIVSGFVAGDRLIFSGARSDITYTQTAASRGTLVAGGMTLLMQGDYSLSTFTAVADVPNYTTTVTVTTRLPPPDPLFDAAFYLARNPDVKAAGVDPYAHYMASGWKEGRDPSVLFNSSYYLAANPDVKAAGVNPLAHYEQSGAMEGRNPDAWFDDRYYLTQNPDVKAAGVNPLLHFLVSGAAEGREPSLVFSDAKYLAANPDVKAAGVNPLAHYVASGMTEGRAALPAGGTAAADPLVNAAYYDAQLGATLIPGGTAGAQQAAASYGATGWQHNLNPDAWFNTAYYLSRNPDVAAAHINPLLHFEASGWSEGRDPSAGFSIAKYLTANPDVRAAGMDPLLHYVMFGQAEGRLALPV